MSQTLVFTRDGETRPIETMGRAELIEVIQDAVLKIHELVNENHRQETEIRDLKRQLSEGIHLKGWWCNAPVSTPLGVMARCDRFNGEEKESHISCRYCGALKGVTYRPGEPPSE
jgi:hypothetical protein